MKKAAASAQSPDVSTVHNGHRQYVSVVLTNRGANFNVVAETVLDKNLNVVASSVGVTCLVGELGAGDWCKLEVVD